MKLLRRIHLYLGCFVTPLLVMYLVSGFYFILNPERQKDEGEAITLMQKMWWMHTDQQWPGGVSEEIDPLSPDQPKTITTWEADTKLFKGLVYLMVVIAISSVIMGLVLAVRSAKDSKPAIAVFLAGILIPVLFLMMGQKQVERPNPFHPDNVDLGPDLGPDAGPGLPPPGSNIGPNGLGLSPIPGGTDNGPSILPPGNPED